MRSVPFRPHPHRGSTVVDFAIGQAFHGPRRASRFKVLATEERSAPAQNTRPAAAVTMMALLISSCGGIEGVDQVLCMAPLSMSLLGQGSECVMVRIARRIVLIVHTPLGVLPVSFDSHRHCRA